MKALLFFLFLLSSITASVAQIVSIEPAFPSRDELVTITYDATLGNAGLIDVAQVYMHTGLITNTSSSGSDWKFVVGNWGTDDARVKMTNIGNNKHQLSFVINEFYGAPENVEIDKLAFVFRNVDGSKEGKSEENSDIFLDYSNGQSFATQLISPTKKSIIVEEGDIINIKFSASEISDIVLTDNDEVLAETNGSTLDFEYTVVGSESHFIEITATFESEVQKEFFNLIVNPDVVTAPYPAGTKLGINQLSETDFRLVLFAPQKSNAYVLGDFNDWKIDTDYFMNRSTDGQSFWIDIEGLDADRNYAFQYLIDGEIVVADPFSELVLDPNNDQWISESTFPNMHPYPSEGASGYVSLLKTEARDYQWQNDFTAPSKEDLVIYEMLIRDFTEDHTYNSLFERLDHLEQLGINAIELMPVNEFEGNLSWGYNPSFHMALDKYYGNPASFKRFVDECHKRGIAVILDVVYNHVFSQSPLAQMYWDAANFRPSAQSPFLNVEAKHPFNVGYDMNHAAPFTRKFVERVTQYWVEEYRIDGFRFDLSKGFTQNFSSNDDQFRAYDQARINTLKIYADNIWSINEDAYIILEHFAANDEEEELSDYGMMLWSNHNFNYNEGTMGYTSGNKSNFEWIDYKQKGWSDPHAVGYMESHDEERLMYKNIQFGNSNGSYNVTELETALERVEMATAFFYTFPGPKMLWQFGELGFDFSINRCEDGSISENCRLSPKPIRWDYKSDINRKKLLDITGALIKLKTEYGLSNTNDYTHNVKSAMKFIKLNSSIANAVVIGNFDVSNSTITPGFPSTGRWYDYISGDSINISNANQSIDLAPGEYHIYLDKKLENQIISDVEDPNFLVTEYKLYPNPAYNYINLDIDTKSSEDGFITIYDQNASIVKSQKVDLRSGDNNLKIDLNGLENGIYHIALNTKEFRIMDRFVLLK